MYIPGGFSFYWGIHEIIMSSVKDRAHYIQGEVLWEKAAVLCAPELHVV